MTLCVRHTRRRNLAPQAASGPVAQSAPAIAVRIRPVGGVHFRGVYAGSN